MTTPYRRGSSPSLIGASGASGASGSSGATAPFSDFPPAWNAQWVLKPPVGSATTVDLTAGPQLPESKIGASGASGGSRWNTKGGGASGSSGATGRPTGIDGVTSLKTDRISGLHNRSRNIVGAVYSDAMPMLSAWGNAGDALFNVLMAGFTSVEDFIETLVRILTGADVDLDFISEGARVFLEILQDIFGPIGEIADWIWTNIGAPLIQGILEVLKGVWDFFGDIADELGIDLGSIFDSITHILGTLWVVFGDAIESILQPASNFLKWLIITFGTVIESFVKPIGTWLYGIWTAIGVPLLTTVIGWVTSVVEVIGVPTLNFIFGTLAFIFNAIDHVIIDNIVQFFADLADNTNLFDFFEDIFNFFLSVFTDFGSLFNGIPLVSNVLDIVENTSGWVLSVINALTGGIFSAIGNALQGLVAWVSTVPFIGPLVQAIVPDEWLHPVTAQPATTIEDLKTSTREILRTNSVVSSYNLQGQIPEDLIPVVSPGFVGDTRPNLVADAGFKSAAALQAGEGWSWDSSESRTVGDGGSAKVSGDGGVKQMFSNLVAVSPGQKLECAVYAKWTKPSAARPTISVGVRAYNNQTVLFTQAVGSQSSVVSNSSGWVLLTGTYDIPANTPMTHVRLALSVLNAPSGTSVWFDEASLKKVSLIGQTLVQGSSPGSNLADDIENSVGSEQYQELLDKVAKKTGATLTDVQATIEDFLDGDSTISGDQIKAGNIASEYINELISTWNTINQGAGGPTVQATGTIQSAFAALEAWRNSISAAGTGILEAKTDAANAVARVGRLETDFTNLRSYVQKMADDVRATTIKVGLTPTTPATPPGETPVTFREAADNFDRTSLGSGWTTALKYNFAGAFYADGNNAYMEAPAIVTVGAIGAAIYNSVTSATDYQRVYVSMGSAPGMPLLGVPGYNDLIGRANDSLTCIVARFYANRTVKLFYRNGSWESDAHNPANTFGTFTLPADITAGSMLEFYIGTKSISDQTACFVKFGSWTSPRVSVSASILSVMGRGWGWGGGNGISGVVAQQSGRVNFWGAQDQL